MSGFSEKMDLTLLASFVPLKSMESAGILIADTITYPSEPYCVIFTVYLSYLKEVQCVDITLKCYS